MTHFVLPISSVSLNVSVARDLSEITQKSSTTRTISYGIFQQEISWYEIVREVVITSTIYAIDDVDGER